MLIGCVEPHPRQVYTVKVLLYSLSSKVNSHQISCLFCVMWAFYAHGIKKAGEISRILHIEISKNTLIRGEFTSDD